MCGIAGILSTTLAPSSARSAASRMQGALAHRGPDDSGLWQSPDGAATLAHRRLSILDLSGAAHQPMSTPDGRFTICFNGEIYNFRELRHELEQAGADFRTSSDTEVILRLYERDGIDCAKRLRGMFAFAVWDAQERTCGLARDPFGIKPLYLHQTESTLAFASEVRALAKSQLFAPTLQNDGLRRYLETGTVPEPLTLISEVRCLPAGEFMVWRWRGAASQHAFWRMDFAPGKSFAGNAVAAARSALIDSVNHHFVSDVPVGVFLSGGIDSTAILALAGITGHQGVGAFSVAVDDEGADESPIARRTAAYFGATYNEMRLNEGKAQELFGQFLNCLDQPTIDGLNTFTVSALARAHGMKVVLSGLGGDELFGGYSSFSTVPKMLKMHRALKAFPGACMAAASTLELLRLRPQHSRLAEFLRSGGSVSDAFSSLRGIFSQGEASKLAAWIGGQPQSSNESRAPDLGGDESVADAVSRLELTRYMRNQLLRDSDVMSMAHGLELRVPFVDSELFRAMAVIPASIRLQTGKRLLTQAVPEVPDWVVNQKKRGFLFPYQKWLGGEWGASIDKAGAGSPVPLINWYQRWSIFVLRHCMANLGLAE